MQSTEKVLTIESEGITAMAILAAVEKAGYKAERIHFFNAVETVPTVAHYLASLGNVA